MNFFPDPAAFSDLALSPPRVFSAVCTDVRRCGPERGLLHRHPVVAALQRRVCAGLTASARSRLGGA